MTLPVDNDLMNRLREAFAGKLYLTRAELAPVLRMTVKTLSRCERNGEIRSRRKGAGTKRPRRVYAFEDVATAEFLKAEAACPLTSQPGLRSTSMTSGAEVIGFSARLALKRSAKPTR